MSYQLSRDLRTGLDAVRRAFFRAECFRSDRPNYGALVKAVVNVERVLSDDLHAELTAGMETYPRDKFSCNGECRLGTIIALHPFQAAHLLCSDLILKFHLELCRLASQFAGDLAKAQADGPKETTRRRAPRDHRNAGTNPEDLLAQIVRLSDVFHPRTPKNEWAGLVRPLLPRFGPDAIVKVRETLEWPDCLDEFELRLERFAYHVAGQRPRPAGIGTANRSGAVIENRPATVNGRSAPAILTPLQRAVVEILESQSPGTGILGYEIIDELSKLKPSVKVCQSTLTRHTIPDLKKLGYPINNRPRVGYYIEDSRPPHPDQT